MCTVKFNENEKRKIRPRIASVRTRGLFFNVRVRFGDRKKKVNGNLSFSVDRKYIYIGFSRSSIFLFGFVLFCFFVLGIRTPQRRVCLCLRFVRLLLKFITHGGGTHKRQTKRQTEIQSKNKDRARMIFIKRALMLTIRQTAFCPCKVLGHNLFSATIGGRTRQFGFFYLSIFFITKGVRTEPGETRSPPRVA